MRKIYLHFAISADGMVSHVERWVSFSDEAMKDSSDWHDGIDTIIFGKNNYAGLAEYWQRAETSSNSAEERAFARKINQMQKLVLSHGDVELAWRNSQLLKVKDDASFKQAINQLKNMPGMNIAVDSGEGTYRSFLENDLWDGIDMWIHPRMIGSGKPLFASMHTMIPLRLVENRSYSDGMVNLLYERV